ncbi:EAL domain-containing protein [Paraburkholderia xenovorans]|jgi:EAL domain-containing protein (putative c-di-GMP-specific phosphodiesterase class I)|uniref:Diguanylate phosphodiesterase (EAL domain) n=1 Tax=Paraburkholderia xenovorans (strain LB400) TaxID=266265 RepID=Q13KE1_PARXL|nr:EAL domain-containing protein [Paraburkholderia xenovorans]ABE35448.1 Putative diguanylate phosphodiesterase (EAL domain) [Paraburkholderia xenovorans LB400]
MLRNARYCANVWQRKPSFSKRLSDSRNAAQVGYFRHFILCFTHWSNRLARHVHKATELKDESVMHTLDYAKPELLTFTKCDLHLPQNRLDAAGSASVELNESESRVRQGLSAGEFHLVFQGAYRAASGTLARLEAQLRWKHPDYGLLLPALFMTALGHPQLALDMALFVVDGVCRELRGCLAANLPLPPVAIAMPAHVALHESFAGEVARVADSYGVPPRLFEIEVSDSAEAAKLLTLRTLTESLRDIGVSITLGNWGNGGSSMALLGGLDVDTVTIARELMATVPRDARAGTVMTALIDLLHALDVRVVVSGVDTEEQLQWLRRWPEVLVQGALVSRPRVGLAGVLEPRR